MDLPGMRYRTLASRCREAAGRTDAAGDKDGLLRMARAYERHAAELEQEFRTLADSAKATAREPENAAAK